MAEQPEPTPLYSICGICTTASPHLRLEPVCASTTQAWTAIGCRRCGQRCLLSVSLWSKSRTVHRWGNDDITDLLRRGREGP